jgi:hypothetical protein
MLIYTAELATPSRERLQLLANLAAGHAPPAIAGSVNDVVAVEESIEE